MVAVTFSNSRRYAAACLATLAVFLAAGCSGRPDTAPVAGRVTASGQPVSKGTVIFMPDRSKGTSGKAAVGDINPDGTYTLRTFGRHDGAIVGHHRVLIRSRALEDDESLSPNNRIPSRYSNPQHSELTAEVKPGSNTIDFNLVP